MKDKFEEFSCEFKNEAECEEELSEDGLDIEDVESKHFHDEVNDVGEIDIEEDID